MRRTTTEQGQQVINLSCEALRLDRRRKMRLVSPRKRRKDGWRLQKKWMAFRFARSKPLREIEEEKARSFATALLRRVGES